MNRVQPSLLAVALLGALTAFAPLQPEVSYHPAEGTSVTRTIDVRQTSALEDMSMVVNGQEMDPSMTKVEMDGDTSMTVTVTDQIASVGEGRPLKLLRTYDALASTTSMKMSHAMMGDMDTDIAASSELEGLTVAFTWDEEAGDYTVAFHEGSTGSEELLEGLVEDMDLRGILPGKEVEPGATWTLDPQVFRGVFAPGGALKLEPEESDDSLSQMGMNQEMPAADEMIGDLTGDATAEFVGVEEADGVQVAVIRVKLDVSSAKDLTAWMTENMAKMEAPMEGMEMSVESFDVEFAFEGEGELRWNLQAGLLHSLTLTGQRKETIDSGMGMKVQGQEMDIENTMDMGGEYDFTLKVTHEG
jgi:hypothetical protein